jgi:hypothetical protein
MASLFLHLSLRPVLELFFSKRNLPVFKFLFVASPINIFFFPSFWQSTCLLINLLPLPELSSEWQENRAHTRALANGAQELAPGLFIWKVR